MHIYSTPATASATTAIPPTTPPAMAPALLLEGAGVGTVLDEEDGGGVVVVDGEELVGNAVKMFSPCLSYHQTLELPGGLVL
jgi:hypothetical protein